MPGHIHEGDVYGHLEVISDTPVRAGKGRSPHYKYLCRCACGVEKLFNGYNLTSGRSKSCGCVRDAETSVRCSSHGMSSSPLYAVWTMMKQRCLNPSYRRYEDYGGRGITVCARWLRFENFFEDMGHPPFPGATIERVDNNGPYSPDNCRWATRVEQGRNKRNTRKFEFNGKEMTLKEWSAEVGIQKETLVSRIYLYGWSIEKALTTEVRA